MQWTSVPNLGFADILYEHAEGVAKIVETFGAVHGQLSVACRPNLWPKFFL